MHSLRLPGEMSAAFRARAEHSARVARVLIDACLANRQIQRLITDGLSAAAQYLHHPIVRMEYEQAIAIGGIGETLAATKYKHWGKGPWIAPLHEDDEFFSDRITYIYREDSLHRRRYEQRRRLKELLGRKHRYFVEMAKHGRTTKSMFLGSLTVEQAQIIQRVLHVTPGQFWRACKGKEFLDLPSRTVQLLFDFESSE
jgi:hypothetical protein